MTRSRQNSGESTAASSPWIYSPWLDLMVGCGAESLFTAKKQIEKRVGVEAPKLRGDPQPALREALALR
jgi:hypothetical protein